MKRITLTALVVGIGLLFAAVFVYLLMVVNYQNFGDPFVVILALGLLYAAPAAGASRSAVARAS